MSNPKDPKEPPAPKGSSEPTAVGTQGGSKRSGRVSHDARGNPVWEWQLETGVYSRDMSTQRLKKLDLGELSIAETAKHKRPEGLEEPPKKPAMPGGGFNPYDSSASAPVKSGGGGFNPYDNSRAAAKPVAKPAAPATPRTPADLKKLEEWMKLKKRIEQQKKDEDDE
jgi:hypothetical protein